MTKEEIYDYYRQERNFIKILTKSLVGGQKERDFKEYKIKENHRKLTRVRHSKSELIEQKEMKCMQR